MKQTEIDYLDGEVTVAEDEPSTIQECIDIIGETAVVDETTSNLRYRNKYPRVYAKASKELEAVVAREIKETKTNKDGTTKNIYVSPMDHLRAALKADAALTAETITRIAQAEPLYVKGERTGGGGKVSQQSMDTANSWFAAGDDTVEEMVGKIEALVPGYKVGRDADGNATPESAARGIQALQKHLQKQAAAQVASALGTPKA